MNQNKWLKYLLSEITTLPKEIYKTLEDELNNSSFWLEPHTDDDIVRRKSPLTNKLETALNSALAKAGVKNTVSKIFTIKGTEKPEHKDSYVGGATHGVSKGKHVIELMIYPFPDEEFELDYGMLIDEIAEVVRHELIHAGQLEKQAAKRGSLTGAEKIRRTDKYQIPQTPETDPRYEEVYYSRKIEIEAFAHQVAEYLIKNYSPEEALRIITQSVEDMPEDVRTMKMWKNLKNNPKALKRFKNRVYDYIVHLTEK